MQVIHEYVLTPHSLYAAVSVGLETETIISVLDRLSKVHLDANIKKFIRESTQNYGKVRTTPLHMQATHVGIRLKKEKSTC